MRARKMHEGEVHVDAALVRRLISAQFPRWKDLPVREARSTGTVNAIYRLGDHLYARLPRVREWAQDLDKERNWLPRLAPRLSLRVPEPVAMGKPAGSYPFPGRSTAGSTANRTRTGSWTTSIGPPGTSRGS